MLGFGCLGEFALAEYESAATGASGPAWRRIASQRVLSGYVYEEDEEAAIMLLLL